MRRLLIILGVGAVAILAVVVVATRSHDDPCNVLTERDLFDSISDVDDRDAQPTMEEAVEAAFSQADMPREVAASDLAPIVSGSGNAVHVGVGGYWLMLARVRDGYVAVSVPKPCADLAADAAP